MANFTKCEYAELAQSSLQQILVGHLSGQYYLLHKLIYLWLSIWVCCVSVYVWVTARMNMVWLRKCVWAPTLACSCACSCGQCPLWSAVLNRQRRSEPFMCRASAGACACVCDCGCVCVPHSEPPFATTPSFVDACCCGCCWLCV